MNLNIRLSKEEHLRSYRKYLLYTSMPVKLLLAAPLALTVLGVLFLRIFGIDFFTNWYVCSIILPAAALLYVLYLAPVSSYQKGKTRRDRSVIEVTDGGIRVSTCHTRSEYKWDTVRQLYEDTEFFYIRFLQNKREVVPKRAFSDQKEEEEFRELFEKKNKLIFVIL